MQDFFSRYIVYTFLNQASPCAELFCRNESEIEGATDNFTIRYEDHDRFCGNHFATHLSVIN